MSRINFLRAVIYDRFDRFFDWFAHWTRIVEGEDAIYSLRVMQGESEFWNCVGLWNQDKRRWVKQVSKGQQAYKAIHFYWRVRRLIVPHCMDMTRAELVDELQAEWRRIRRMGMMTVTTRHFCGFGISKREPRNWTCVNIRHMSIGRGRDFQSRNEMDKGIHWFLNHTDETVRNEARRVILGNGILVSALEDHFEMRLADIRNVQ